MICGDLFSDEVKGKLDSNLDYLLVPMSRSFYGKSPDRERWEKTEREEYLEAAESTGITTVIVNALEIGVKEPAFGGAMAIDAAGTLIAEAMHGTDHALVLEFSTIQGG